MDVVICIGPNDYDVAARCIESIKVFVPRGTIYCIVPPSFPHERSDVVFVREDAFPFNKGFIDTAFKTPQRSGWYLQQLLKLYAPSIISQLSDTYLIVDADVVFHRPVTFVHNDTIAFNTGTEYHLPYFSHMARLLPGLQKVRAESGICHLMPMKRHIVAELVRRVEVFHGKPFWVAFLECVNGADYPGSGASEYEILFSFTLTEFPNDAHVRPIGWRNSDHVDPNYAGVYEAVHHYMRR